MITKQEESTGYLFALEQKAQGNFGHIGRPGKVGGSGPGGSSGVGSGSGGAGSAEPHSALTGNSERWLSRTVKRSDSSEVIQEYRHDEKMDKLRKVQFSPKTAFNAGSFKMKPGDKLYIHDHIREGGKEYFVISREKNGSKVYVPKDRFEANTEENKNS